MQAELRSIRKTKPQDIEQHQDNASPKTSAEKVALFRNLFRGREDVFPRLWINTKTGKKGYPPACNNDWLRKVCGKTLSPPVKCGSCGNQAFIQVSDHVILGHLKGRYVAGVYPLLPNDTCHFLAVDFDKHTWMEDISAFRETSRTLGLPVAVERSRSGKGAHAWFFFSSPTPAEVARRMGSYLITETMSRRHELSMESYDRLFPNQDTMPKGGFGNLIALPFQQGPREEGNTVFVDEDFSAYHDQWAFLASIKTIPAEKVQQVTDEAARRGQVLGACLRIEDEEDTAPWEQLPSRFVRSRKISGQLPKEVRAITAQRLFVEEGRTAVSRARSTLVLVHRKPLLDQWVAQLGDCER